MSFRPVLKPALRRLWRDDHTLQLGVEPRHAVVLAGLGAAERTLLELLDGSRDTTALFAAADAAGLDAAQVRRFVDSLAAADVLEDATHADGAVDEGQRQRLTPDRLALSLRRRGPGAADRALARRRATAVDVHGAGRVGATVAGLLAAGGVGRVGCIDSGAQRAADLCPLGPSEAATASRGMASAEQVRRTAPATDVRTSRLPGAALAVVAPVTGVVPPETAAAVRRQVHLVVVVRETTAAVGPFVVPGLTACLRCVELARSERDPQWPALAAQLVGASRAVEACDIALATLAASLATLHALTWLDGDELPPSAGGVLEVDLEGARLRRRSVAAHPECGCGAAG